MDGSLAIEAKPARRLKRIFADAGRDGPGLAEDGAFYLPFYGGGGGGRPHKAGRKQRFGFRSGRTPGAMAEGRVR